MKARHVRSLSVAALPLVTGIVAGSWLATPAVAQESEGPRYSYFDAGYQWADVNYAIKAEGGQHEGWTLHGSLGLVDFGSVGLHLFGDYFDGEFSGARDTCSGSVPERDSTSYAGGLGLDWDIAESTDLVGRAGFVHTEIEVPVASCALQTVEDDGYTVEGLVRRALSDKADIEAGVRYSDLSDSDIGNTDVILGLAYNVTESLALRASGIVFDDDTGFEISARFYFGNSMGRDNVF